MDFSTETSRRNLKIGYYDAYKTFKKLKGIKFYIEPVGDERLFIDLLGNMNDDKVQRVCKLFGINQGSKRILFEEIIPKLAYLLNLPEISSYEDIAIGLLEKAAASLNIERFRTYTVEELYHSALQQMPRSGEFLKDPPVYIRNRELISKVSREKLINNIAAELFVNENMI
jgi:NTE family protein